MQSQMSMMDLWGDDAPRFADLPRRQVAARAYGGETELTVVGDAPDPIQVEVAGIACTVAFDCDFGFSTYVIDGPGAKFWSETGFRSFGVGAVDAAQVSTVIERFIAAPARDGNGMGGRMVRWWPCYALQWRATLAMLLKMNEPRAQLWTQWGPERHAEIWARKDRDFAAALARMQAAGIDPNDVGAPHGWRGSWPRVTYTSELQEFAP